MAAHNFAPEEIRGHMRRVRLNIPVQVGDGFISEVYLRRPTARYLAEREAIGDADEGVEATYRAVSLATGLTRDEVLEIDLADFQTVTEEIADFFDPKEPTATA